MRTVLFVLAAFLATASFLPYFRHEAWWIRVFDFPRAQILVLGLLGLGLFFLYGNIRTWDGIGALGAIAAAIIVQARSIFPYTPWATPEVISAPRALPESNLSLLVANVLMTNRQANRLLRLIATYRPDIVLLLEPDAWWENALRVVEENYPYVIREPRDNRYGMLVYSRLALLDPEIRHLVSDTIPSMHTRVRLPSGREVWLHCVHPEPPSPTEAETSLPRDAELLIVGREVKGRARPTIVAGDLNDVAWSYTTRLFQEISSLLDPRKGRGMFNTFHARIPFMRWPLDHVFHSDHFLLGDMRRLPAFGSDHFPVYVRLVLQPGAETLQEGPRADEEDEETARTKIAKVGQRETL